MRPPVPERWLERSGRPHPGRARRATRSTMQAVCEHQLCLATSAAVAHAAKKERSYQPAGHASQVTGTSAIPHATCQLPVPTPGIFRSILLQHRDEPPVWPSPARSAGAECGAGELRLGCRNPRRAVRHGFNVVMTVEGTTDTDLFRAYVDQVLAPAPAVDDAVVMDNLGTTRSAASGKPFNPQRPIALSAAVLTGLLIHQTLRMQAARNLCRTKV